MAGYSTSFPPSLVTQGITYNGGPRTWIYTTTDATATIDTAGYFSNGAFLGMKVGDMVLVYISGSPGTVTLNTYVVDSVNTTTGAVDVRDGTVVGSTTDTD